METVNAGRAKPIISTIFTADPSGVVGQDGKLYIYPSQDLYPPRGCDLMDRYHVYSTENMVEFLDEGEILRADDVPWGRPEGGFMWAPDCIFKNGKYYYYYPHATLSRWSDSWVIGVAVSDYPNKGFRDIGYVKNSDGTPVYGFGIIDPCIFIDGGVNYLYYGGCGRACCCILEDDMVTFKGDVYSMEGLEDYHEAPWVFKRNGIYYMTHSDNHQPHNFMRYAMSASPLGPWKACGVYIGDVGSDTTHGSVFEYKGRWYALYHNCAISGGRGNLRSVCVDELFFNDDGTIRMLEQTDHACEPVGPARKADPRTTVYPAGRGCRIGTVQYDGRAVYGFNAENKEEIFGRNGLRFTKINGFDGGRANIRIRYANGGAPARVRLTVNSCDWGLLNILPTGGDGDFSGSADFTVTNMKPGFINSICIERYEGDARIESVTVEPLD